MKQNCRNFDTCSAALCPLDLNPKHFWYCDTEVCWAKNVPEWVKTQRKISKFNQHGIEGFTVKMLESIKRIDKEIRGIQTKTGYDKKLEESWLNDRTNRH